MKSIQLITVTIVGRDSSIFIHNGGKTKGILLKKVMSPYITEVM